MKRSLSRLNVTLSYVESRMLVLLKDLYDEL